MTIFSVLGFSKGEKVADGGTRWRSGFQRDSTQQRKEYRRYGRLGLHRRAYDIDRHEWVKKRVIISHLDLSKFNRDGYSVLVEESNFKLSTGELITHSMTFHDTFHLRWDHMYAVFVPCGSRPESIKLSTVGKVILDGKTMLRWRRWFSTVPAVVRMLGATKRIRYGGFEKGTREGKPADQRWNEGLSTTTTPAATWTFSMTGFIYSEILWMMFGVGFRLSPQWIFKRRHGVQSAAGKFRDVATSLPQHFCIGIDVLYRLFYLCIVTR